MTSAWCTHPPGITRHSAAQHGQCQQRQDDGQIQPCPCADYGGHDANPQAGKGSERLSAIESGAESGPESALTDRGLATVSTRPKGA